MTTFEALRAAAWQVLHKHLPGKHDQLTHGHRYRTGPDGKRERVETRAEGRRKRLAAAKADYERARDRVRERVANAIDVSEMQLTPAKGEAIVYGGRKAKPGDLVRRGPTGSLWEVTAQGPSNSTVTVKPASRAARQERTKAIERLRVAREAAARYEAEQRAAAEAKAKAEAEKATRRKPAKMASERQVAYAMRLIRAGRWHDSDAGQYSGPPTRKQLAEMTSREISALIDDLKGSSW